MRKKIIFEEAIYLYQRLKNEDGEALEEYLKPNSQELIFTSP
jgi:hypothetical protein